MRLFSFKLQACYDVREASVFWAKMSSSDPELEWLSTHPSSETRQFVLESLMPTAIQLREKCKVRHIHGRILNIHFYWYKWVSVKFLITEIKALASNIMLRNLTVGSKW
jgi:hypothetical protein